MKTKSIYFCEYCNASFESFSDCQYHEAKHLHLTFDAYLKLHSLNLSVEHAVSTRCVSANPETREAESFALKSLSEFLEQHKLKDSDIPSHFYY